MPDSLKHRIWTTFEDPQTSTSALGIAMFLMGLILVSCVAFCVQTLTVFYSGDQAVWDGIEAVCILCFSVEYVLRLACCPDRRKFLTGFLNSIDLVAIAPFYVELAIAAMAEGDSDLAGLQVFRVVRLARIFRLFKLGRYSSGMQTFANTMVKSARPLLMLVFFMSVGIVLTASAIYYCERGDWDECQRKWMRECASWERRTQTGSVVRLCNCTQGAVASPFKSIPVSFYWAAVTMTTVGYGDMYPTTSKGMLVASVTMITGILILALPITVIGSNFAVEYAEFLRQQRIDKQVAREGFNQAPVAQKDGDLAVYKELDWVASRSRLELRAQIDQLIRESRDDLVLKLNEVVGQHQRAAGVR